MREIARRLGRPPSTVTREVRRNGVYLRPRGMEGERFPAEGPDGPCGLLASSPGMCNGCRKRACGCSRTPKAVARCVEVDDIPLCRRGLRRHKQHGAAAQGRLQAEEEEGPAQADAPFRPQVARGVPRAARGRPGRLLGDGHGEGRAGDSAAVLTLLNRATRIQLALPLASQTSAETVRALGALRALLRDDDVRRVFAVVLINNGGKFADEAGIAAALCERPGETRLFYCDPMCSDQKGAYEKNHVEIRKLLPKGRSISFDRLTREDCALLMSHVNSEPRGCPALLSPSSMLDAAFGGDARPHRRLRDRAPRPLRAGPDPRPSSSALAPRGVTAR